MLPSLNKVIIIIIIIIIIINKCRMQLVSTDLSILVNFAGQCHLNVL